MNNHKKWVSQVFDRTAYEYGKNSSSFFNYFGKRLVDHASVCPGQHVLDVATGRGAVLYPLADAVGQSGKVIGIDISEQMIYETSKEVTKRKITWIELICMDAEELKFQDNSFDFVFCGFGVFFLPSIPSALSEFKRVLKPKGKLVLSTWGEDSVLDLLVNNEMKKLCLETSLIASPLWSDEELRKQLNNASFKNIEIFEETKTFVHKTAKHWLSSLWTHATRAKLEQLSAEELEKFQKQILEKAKLLDKGEGIEEKLHVYYGIAEKN